LSLITRREADPELGPVEAEFVSTDERLVGGPDNPAVQTGATAMQLGHRIV